MLNKGEKIPLKFLTFCNLKNKIKVKIKKESDFIFLEMMPFYRVVKTISSNIRMIKVETY